MPADFGAALDLVNADRVPGQPPCAPEDLSAALAGKAEIDRYWWNHFGGVKVLVAENERGGVVGFAAYAVTRDTNEGYILWVHGREKPAVIRALLRHIGDELRGFDVKAFWIATPLALGFEGLPVRHRKATHSVLRSLGFYGEDDWLLMQGKPAEVAQVVGRVRKQRGKEAWDIVISDAGKKTVAEAKVELGPDGIGFLWWIEVDPKARGKGYGRALLGQARKVLGDAGADRVVLFVDHDNPEERDRRPAIKMYEEEGFEVVDHLYSYQYEAR